MHLKFISYGLLIFIILTVAFSYDVTFSRGEAQGGQKDQIWDKGLETLVYGRLAKSSQDGMFSAGGLLGMCYIDKDNFIKYHRYDKKYQIDFYLNKSCPNYGIYKSHPGMQAMLFSLMSKMNASPFTFELAASMLLSAAITLWLIWISNHFGLLAGVLTAASLLSLRWFIIIGSNIYLMLGAIYLPMVVIAWSMHKKWTTLLIISFAAFLFESLIAGASYIFCGIVMCFVPVIFYAVKEKWAYKIVRRKILAISLGIFLAITLSVVTLVTQISAMSSLSKGIHHIIYTTGERTYGDPGKYPEKFRASLDASLGKMINNYLDMSAIKIRTVHISISFRLLITLFMFTSILTFIIFLRTKNMNLLALLITTWLSILGPLSWLTICKSHSYDHPFLTPIIWHMPFVLFGFALFFVTIIETINLTKRDFIKNKI